ncbi:MAG: membrane dipeptidase [Deltaproteobacteria bacterium]|nr:membrane dipeptidase [Deltaproteobacteria bacterium]
MITRRVIATTLLLWFLGCGGCGGSSDESSGKDFIGQEEVSSPKTAAPKRTRTDLFTVDLITDVVFRYMRDGWTLRNKSDVTGAKLRAGGVNLVFSAVGTSPKGKPNLDEGISITHKLVKDAGSDIAVATSFSEVLENQKKGIVSVMILVEGAGELENADEDRLYELKRKGVTAIGLVGGRTNRLADAAVSGLGSKGGLTKRGGEFVQLLRELGIAVDLTQASKEAFYDVLVREGILAMVSHSAVDALRPHPRNLDDLQILSLARSGGVMGLVFNPDFIITTPGTDGSIDDVIAHMVHIKKLGAIDALALGTDFAGIYPPKGLKDISYLPVLADAMLDAGFTSDEIAKVFGKNTARYFENISAQQGTAEIAPQPVLRPIDIDCDTFIGDVSGIAVKSCDHRVLEDGPSFAAGARQKFRLRDMSRKPARLEVFGVPDTPWQVEAQDLSGRVLVKRVIRLDDTGKGQVPLPENRNVTRLFLNPARPSMLREVVVWGD